MQDSNSSLSGAVAATRAVVEEVRAVGGFQPADARQQQRLLNSTDPTKLQVAAEIVQDEATERDPTSLLHRLVAFLKRAGMSGKHAA